MIIPTESSGNGRQPFKFPRLADLHKKSFMYVLRSTVLGLRRLLEGGLNVRHLVAAQSLGRLQRIGYHKRDVVVFG